MSRRSRSKSADDLVTPPSGAPQLITLRQAAERLSLSYWAVRDLVIRGHLPAVRLPGTQHKDLRRVLIDEADLTSFIAAHRKDGRALPKSK
jgi:excisionase family DNA binding protein